MAVEKGDKVKVDYEGKLEDGNVFDTSKREGGKPLEFVAGSGMVIPGFDNAVLGMEKDEEKTVTIEPAEAYGEVNPELVREIPRNVLPKDQEPKKGMMLVMSAPDGRQIPAVISEVTEESVKIDLNHPLAGKKLIFKIKVLEITDAKDVKEEHSCCGEECKCENDGECGDECSCEESNKDEPSIEDLAEGK
jgi:FKBP-type peptidyl-prolyl cis-trans isomerase 2